MKKFGSGVVLTSGMWLAAACQAPPCDQQMMVDVVNKDIRAEGGRTKDYLLAEIKNYPDGVYVGMSSKQSPMYRRHYILDRTTCKIVDAKIDQ